jgi:hypothetical protein
LYPSYFTYGSSNVIYENLFVNDVNASYQFTLVNTNPIPTSGYLLINVSLTTLIPGNLLFTCLEGCTGTNISLTYGYFDHTLILRGLFAEYLQSFSKVELLITGFTNPSDYEDNLFTVSSYYTSLDGNDYVIDRNSFNFIPLCTIDIVSVDPKI